jgi:hypothetical protein
MFGVPRQLPHLKTPHGNDFNRLPDLNRAAGHDLAAWRFIDEKVAVCSCQRSAGMAK